MTSFAWEDEDTEAVGLVSCAGATFSGSYGVGSRGSVARESCEALTCVSCDALTSASPLGVSSTLGVKEPTCFLLLLSRDGDSSSDEFSSECMAESVESQRRSGVSSVDGDSFRLIWAVGVLKEALSSSVLVLLRLRLSKVGVHTHGVFFFSGDVDNFCRAVATSCA